MRSNVNYRSLAQRGFCGIAFAGAAGVAVGTLGEVVTLATIFGSFVAEMVGDMTVGGDMVRSAHHVIAAGLTDVHAFSLQAVKIGAATAITSGVIATSLEPRRRSLSRS